MDPGEREMLKGSPSVWQGRCGREQGAERVGSAGGWSRFCKWWIVLEGLPRAAVP